MGFWALDPTARFAPACLHLRDTQQPVASLAIHLGAIPFKQISSGAAYAGWRCKQMEALLAAQLLIAQCPPQARKRKQNEVQYLEEVRSVRDLRKNWDRHIRAQQEGEKQYLGDLQCQEELTV